MDWYALVGLLAILILVIENHDILFHRRAVRESSDIKIYRLFLYGILAYYVTDMFWGVLDGMHLTALLYADTVVYYLAMAVGILLWTRYVVAYLRERNVFSRFLVITGHVFFVVVAVITIINCFTPILFWFDETGTYHACPARHAQLIFQIVLLLLTSLYTFRATLRTKGAAKNRYRTIFLFGLVVAVLLLIQLKYPFLPLYTIGYMLGSCLLHIFVVSNEMEEYRKETELAAASNQAKSAFLSNMSHEIRTPINAILGMNEMILRESSEESILEYSESIHTAGNTLLSLINDILDFSKIEAGKLEITPVDYDLSSVLNDLVLMVRTRADDKGLVLKPDFDRDMPKLLHGDEVRVKQIITNILTNAVKYTEKGSVTFCVTFEKIPEEAENVFLKVSVRDTGIGIRPEDQEKLFSEYERIEEDRNRNIEGTGLGLSITRSLLAMMESRLHVESEYGKGSVFSFRLKQKVISWEKLGDYEEAFRASLSHRKKSEASFIAKDATVLVVDDNNLNLMVFKSLLKRTQIQVDMGESGDEGIALACKKKYDLIFFDHMMPEKDGIETLHELRSLESNQNKETPVICLTANAISGAREEYINAGFDDYLTKPIDAERLEEMLLHYLPDEKIEEAPLTEGDGPEEEKENALPPELLTLSKEPWIDVEAGIRNSGMADAYLPLLRIFYTSLDEKAEELDRFYDENNLPDYTIKVHALKSSARIIGITGFGEKAQKLEDAGKSGDTDYIRSHHKAFMEEYLSFKEPLGKLFPDEADSDKPEADEALMEGVFEELLLAAENMDCDRLSDIFEEMEDYRIPAVHAGLWKNCREAADNYDYHAITELLKKG